MLDLGQGLHLARRRCSAHFLRLRSSGGFEDQIRILLTRPRILHLRLCRRRCSAVLPQAHASNGERATASRHQLRPSLDPVGLA